LRSWHGGIEIVDTPALPSACVPVFGGRLELALLAVYGNKPLDAALGRGDEWKMEEKQ
jgi:hypothetical protein